MKFWHLLMMFLCLPVDGDEGGDKGGTGGDEGGGDSLEDGVDLDEIIDSLPAKKADEDGEGGRANDAVRKARERAQAEERKRIELETENRMLREASQRREQAPPVDDESRVRAQEDADLERARASGDQNYYENMKWRVDSMRHNRQVERNAAQALFRANDLSDKSEFARLGDSRDSFVKATYNRFAKKVEEVREEQLRRGFAPTDRMVIFDHMVGKALREGDIKRKTPATRKDTTNAGEQGRQVPRGQSPGAKSDVASRQRSSESQKRRERLENQQI